MPAAAGIGLRSLHLAEVAASSAPPAPWFEVHSENFLSAGGPRRAGLAEIAARAPISCHGVGMSLGSHAGLDRDHLRRLNDLFGWVRPALVSEHLSWSVVDGVYLNDLLPLPLTEEALDVVARNVDHAQDFFGRRILVENPSSYLTFAASTMSEPEFLTRLVDRTGCGLLLDVNNVYVSAANNGFDAAAYLARIPPAAVGEIHLAGHTVQDDGAARVLVDTHSARVCDPVWALYEAALARTGPVPTLIEWDLDIPPLAVLLDEAARAQALIDAVSTAERADVA
ncbi:MAG: DUF692 domain-containing protein [Rhodospirillaceae bacterium]|nr:DUF692 domain-containing protein [Rhodospirillaceae bacterium]